MDLGGFRKIHGQPPGHAKKYYGIRVRTGIKFKLLGPKGTALEFAPKLNLNPWDQRGTALEFAPKLNLNTGHQRGTPLELAPKLNL